MWLYTKEVDESKAEAWILLALEEMSREIFMFPFSVGRMPPTWWSSINCARHSGSLSIRQV